MSDRYEIRDKIGQGGVGAVYKAFDTQLKREVALKRLLPGEDVEAANAEEFTDNLLKEATTLSALQHPNIVTIFDVGKDAEGAFVVMELLRGESFDETIERGALPVEDFKNVVAQTLEAMIAAQALDVVHRDLKPGNLMVIWLPSGKFQIKILDFGLAKFGQQPSKQTADQGDGILGSIYFMAPEQFERIELDARTDMYALGSIYYYALTGEYPFRGENAPQVMAAHLQNRVQPLESIRPDLPHWICNWVMWLIRREMKDRPLDAKEALEFFNKEQSGFASGQTRRLTTGAPTAQLQTAPPKAVAQGPIAVPKPARAPSRLIAPAAIAVPAGGGAVLTAQAVPPQAQPGLPPFEAAAALRPGVPAPRTGTSFPKWALFTVPLLAAIVILVAIIQNKNRDVVRDYHARLVELTETEHPEGDAATVKMLVDLVRRGGNNGIAALSTLHRLEGVEVNEAIVASLHKVKDEARPGIIGCIVGREIPGAIADIARYLEDKYPKDVRDAAVYAIGTLGSQSELTDLLIALGTTTDDSTRRTLEGAIIAISSQVAEIDKRATRVRNELRDAKGAHRNSLLYIAAHLGGELAWRDLERALSGNDKDAKIAVLKGIMNWPDFTPADRLFELARDTDDTVIRLHAISAYLALLSRPSAMSAKAKVSRLKELIPLAARAKDKRQLLSAATLFIDESALELAKSWENDNALGPYAKRAVAQIQQALDKLVTIKGEGALPASMAIVAGDGGIQYSKGDDAITDWDMQNTWVRWAANFSEPGKYTFTVKQATDENGGSHYTISVAGQNIEGKVEGTGGNDSFKEVAVGEIDIVNPGNFIVDLTPTKLQDYELMILREVGIKRVGDVSDKGEKDS